MKKVLSVLTALILCAALLFAGNRLIKHFPNAAAEISAAISSHKDAPEVEDELKQKTCYYYKSLSAEQQKAYRLLYTAFKAFDENCTLPVPEEEVKAVWTAVLYDNPEIFWIRNDYEFIDFEKAVQLSPHYSMTKDEADRISKELEASVEELAGNAQELTGDYEKELYFHDYICENTVYDEATFGNIGNTAYSALLNGRAICEGYARAMQILLDRAGIHNYLVVGKGVSEGKSEPHIWNIVWIDGAAYHLDVTWDDLDNGVAHIYFNLTDSDISKDHTEISPADNGCNSVSANYFHKTGAYITEFSDFGVLANSCAELIKKDIYLTEIRFAEDADFRKALDILKNGDSFFLFLDRVSQKSGGKIKTDEISYIPNEENQCLIIIFTPDKE